MRGRPSAEVDDGSNTPEALRSRGDHRREQKKSEEELMELGTALSNLNDRLLARLALPEEVLDAVVAARSIRELGPRNRALRLVRIALRAVDAALIRNKLRDLHETPRAAPTPPANALDDWRERLLAGGEEALSEFIATFPDGDRRHIRQLSRNVRAALESSRKESVRLLEKALRVHLG